MTIRKGEPWGIEVSRPAGLTMATSDPELVARSHEGVVGVAGGDVFRCLGSPPTRDPVQQVEIDGLTVVLDHERELEAVAHVVARRSWWSGRVVACMNVDHIGNWNVAPRAHPNDGRFDVVECDASMSRRDRWAAWRRLPNGTHLPHPALSVGRAAAGEWAFDRPHRIWIDGVLVGRARHLTVRIVPDHYTVMF